MPYFERAAAQRWSPAHGPLLQCFHRSKAQDQPACSPAPVAKAYQSASFHSIKKGNWLAVSPYWTVLDSDCALRITRNLMIALLRGGGFEPPTFGL